MSSGSSQNGVSLDISGVAGFFGGDVSVSAMATVHIYEGRKWLGWYNQPGSYEIAKRYGQLSTSRFWDALYPGVNVDPATLFEFDGTQGPKYTAVQSGTVIARTGHVARLFMEECKEEGNRVLANPTPEQRTTSPGLVTVVDLSHVPHEIETPHQQRDVGSVLACVPIFVSLSACVVCAVFGDWFCFSMILLGIVASGFSCYTVGMGTLTFKHPMPAQEAPPGDGLLEGENELVILKGPEGAVNSITRGRFYLEYASKPRYNNIGWCSILLTFQFLAQLLIVPQGTLRGQIAFLVSLAASWAYNSYLSSLDKERIQRSILVEQVLKLDRSHHIKKYELGTRTSMVVFSLLLLAPANTRGLRRVLNDLLPNDTDVWNRWKDEVLVCIERDLHADTREFAFRFKPLAPADRTGPCVSLLETLRSDAAAAAEMYTRYHGNAYTQSSTMESRPSMAYNHYGSLSYGSYAPLGADMGAGSSESLMTA
ncbi:hypothetical protein GY45DRAFT_1335754 [Cubamyces sp. BRFM 1775]|nr:hypothetical protein GY45DRAFT_1335754 [Cubamyces sp. BRFM 1775]